MFGIGFAPRSGEALLRHLRAKGFTEEELVASGHRRAGPRGLYDRFRGPAAVADPRPGGGRRRLRRRRLFDDDSIEAKYLNTPRRRSTRSRRCSTASTWPKREIARPGASSSSRGTPT
jgi:DNA primase